MCFFFFYWSGDHRDLHVLPHSFPTRRSSDLPTRDGRIGNGVGLDTPAAAVNILRALQAEGYPLPTELPASGTALIQQLLGGVSNDLDSLDQIGRAHV